LNSIGLAIVGDLLLIHLPGRRTSHMPALHCGEPTIVTPIVCLWSITEPSKTVMHVGEGEGEG
jgi:hypothetical protein